MKYKAALFDLGSTLIEYENHSWDELGKMGIMAAFPYLQKKFAHLTAVSEFGPLFYKQLRDILDSRTEYSEVELLATITEIFKRLGLRATPTDIESFAEIYYKPVTDQLTMISNADVILEKLKKAGLKIGLVSNSIFPEKYHRKEMESLGLLKYFDFTIFSSTVGMRKPGKAIFDIALKTANVRPSEAIFTGDRFDVDIAGAANAGIVSVWKYRAGRENPDGIEPDYSIEDLIELETIILK